MSSRDPVYLAIFVVLANALALALAFVLVLVNQLSKHFVEQLKQFWLQGCGGVLDFAAAAAANAVAVATTYTVTDSS